MNPTPKDRIGCAHFSRTHQANGRAALPIAPVAERRLRRLRPRAMIGITDFVGNRTEVSREEGTMHNHG